MESKFDFGGWATRNGIKCSDGRTIQRDAFKHNDGQTVPLVWNHQHNDPLNILGHARLENHDKGVYAYCKFNDTESGRNAKLLVEHGDVTALSIFANGLKQQGANVLHGVIKEVSLVLAGANPGAFIDSIMQHGEVSEDAAEIYNDKEGFDLYHSENKKEEDESIESKKEEIVQEEKKMEHESEEDKTVAEVFDTLSEEQKTVVYALIGQALDDEDSTEKEDEPENEPENEGGNDSMKHNIFDREETQGDFLTHADVEAIFSDAKRYGTLSDAVLAHGIEKIDYLFPDAKPVTNTPQFIQRDTGWVAKVMGGVHHTPFSRIKSILADITAEDARAKGYITGTMKKEEVFSLLKRTTSPTTVYKKQKLERDDVIDITDFDVVAWLKSEMRGLLDEELARAYLIGDGRLNSSDDKINDQNIRPIWTDENLYTVKAEVKLDPTATPNDAARAFIRTAIKSRKNYKGSGEPVLYTTEDVLTDCLLIEDTTGRIIYDSVAKLATSLRVKEIITVPVMENQTREADGDMLELMGIIVNLNDYNVGADKGGAVNMFDDFDIDYNAQKYLIETRCSGALIKPFSAIAIETKVAG